MGSADVSAVALWSGRILTAIASIFLLVDAMGKIMKVQQVVEGTQNLGYPESIVQGLGILLLACTAVYLFPRTTVVGAVLLTGYLGGAVATHVRVSSPWLTHVLFPVYLAAFIWGGLLLRLPRVASVIPWME